MGDYHFTILFVFGNDKIRRAIDVKTVEELYGYTAQELKLPHDRISLKYFDPEFEELVTLDDLSCVPQKVKIEVTLLSPRLEYVTTKTFIIVLHLVYSWSCARE
eukprot:TRINITY_DN289_c0_g2_i4.p1 TRINITY_DN289_c0_g2~~TRINITY_DN289_c0_g2_i4.p1  ORF type:complete len:104 (+),score=14.35 TRINITY_DN289_c0_g2_i4:101-412(+)